MPERSNVIMKLVKELQFRSPLRRYFFPRFFYTMTAPQLCFLCECLNRTRDVPGGIVEVGCANGATTIFLAKYLEAEGIWKDYTAVDTFSGFVDADVEFERKRRGKGQANYRGFSVNDQRWYDGTMKLNGIDFVRSIKADVNHFEFAPLGPLSFCLLDVDLYLPIKNSIGRIYDQLSPAGILVVDDCDLRHELYDGAAHAFEEFVGERGLDREIVLTKFGVLRKAP